MNDSTTDSRSGLRPTFDGLPTELLESVAAQLCRLTPIGPPSGLINLMVLNSTFYHIFGPPNYAFYADLFKERFDWKSVERRWDTMKRIEDMREKRSLLETVGSRTANDDLILNAAGSFTRDNSPDLLLSSKSVWRPFTSKDLAVEFKRRCTILRKMRASGLSGSIPSSSSRPGTPKVAPSSPKFNALTPTGDSFKLPIAEPDELTQQLWTCYLMLLENDGKNVVHLMEYGLLRNYMKLFYKHSLFSEALRPGWPRQTAARALGLWIGWLGGDDFNSETAQESDERFFVLKPYVFGAHKFDAFHVPWTIGSLPVSPSTHPMFNIPPSGPFVADLRPRTQAQRITHMGRSIELAPPILSHAAIFSFFFRVERNPESAGDAVNHTLTQLHPPAAPTLFPGTPLTNGKPTKTSLPTLVSSLHDVDFSRLVSCPDPYSSLGLPSLFSKGQLNGSWEGRFSFFDFDSYREMLGGRMRSLYEGPFGDQPQVWKLEEQIVRVDRGKGEKRGGSGPVMNAGYEIGSRGPKGTFEEGEGMDWNPTGRGEGNSGGGGGGSSSRRGVNGSAGHRLDNVFDAGWGEEGEEGEEEGQEDYEILLTGFGHSAWGMFRLKGRIRSWDGLFSITKEYTPDSRGRWLYRGYCIGGTNLVGRWRDTHTPVDMSGYEGTFLMSRRSL